jgi:hypothetical protein
VVSFSSPADAILPTPDQGELRIELKGNLAAMQGAATKAKRSPETGDLWLQIVMVAGADLNLRPLGYEPNTAAQLKPTRTHSRRFS